MGDNPRYKRILIKLSGESLTGDGQYGIDPGTVGRICDQIERLQGAGVEVAVVIGGGNIFRGLKASEAGMDRVTADNMGMLATVINALAIQDNLNRRDVPARVLSAVRMDTFAEKYLRRNALAYLEKGQVIILAAGTGHPYFTTDTAAALRGIETGAEIIFKATRVDGVYSADPEVDKKAEFFPELTYIEVLDRDLKVMDAASIALCKDNKMPILIFNLNAEDSLYRAGMGEQVGTLVH